LRGLVRIPAVETPDHAAQVASEIVHERDAARVLE
jgi:hypothetical protein